MTNSQLDKCVCKFFKTPKGHVGDKPRSSDFYCEVHGQQHRDFTGTIGVDVRAVARNDADIRHEMGQSMKHAMNRANDEAVQTSSVPPPAGSEWKKEVEDKYFRRNLNDLLNCVEIFITEAEQRGREEALRCNRPLPDGSICRVSLDCHLHDWRADLDREKGFREGSQQMLERAIAAVENLLNSNNVSRFEGETYKETVCNFCKNSVPCTETHLREQPQEKKCVRGIHRMDIDGILHCDCAQKPPKPRSVMSHPPAGWSMLSKKEREDFLKRPIKQYEN